MCFVQGTGEASILLPLHPPFPPSFYPSVLLSLLPSLCPSSLLAIPPSLHPTSSCPAPRLPALSLLLSPSLVQEQVLPTPHATSSTPPGEWGWLFCCHDHQDPFPAPLHAAHGSLALFPLPSWQVPSFSPFCLGTSNLQALCPGQLCSGFHRHWMEGLWHLLGAVGHLSGALGCPRMIP